jgi:hypothetical protein
VFPLFKKFNVDQFYWEISSFELVPGHDEKFTNHTRTFTDKFLN